MSRMKVLNQQEYRKAVASLVDLGFTVPAIAYITGKSHPATYTLLDRMGRWKNGEMVRLSPNQVDPQAVRFMERVFLSPLDVLPVLQTIAKVELRYKNGKVSNGNGKAAANGHGKGYGKG